jgi:hypothetical protein
MLGYLVILVLQRLANTECLDTPVFSAGLGVVA